MKLLNYLLLACLCFFLLGCIRPHRGTKLKKPPISKPITAESTSVLKVEASAVDLQGIQKYIGAGNTVSFADKATFDFNGTKLSVPAKATAKYVNEGETIAITFGDPKPEITTSFWGIKLQPLLEKVIIQPTGGVDVTVNEFGRHITKKAIVKWSDETALSPENKKPVVWGWSTEGCVPCVSAHSALDNNNLPFTVLWNPQGVPNPYDTYPSFAWSTADVPSKNMKQNWKQNGWPGKDKFLKTFNDSRTPPKASAALPSGWHTHTCSKARCRFSWSHLDNDPRASHNCPRCGTVQYEISQRG